MIILSTQHVFFLNINIVIVHERSIFQQNIFSAYKSIFLTARYKCVTLFIVNYYRIESVHLKSLILS